MIGAVIALRALRFRWLLPPYALPLLHWQLNVLDGIEGLSNQDVPWTR
jgi:hypothetical protein